MGWTRFFRRARCDAERAAEIEAHVQMEFDRNLAIGMAPADARAAAHRKFGSPTSTREEIYRMNTLALVENFAHDVAYGLRTLSKSPGFTAVAILSLALGIGANTAIYGVSVVKDVRQSNNLREAAPASIYWPTFQPQTSPSARPIEGAVLSIRAQDNPASLIEPLRTLFRESRARAGNMRTQQAIIEAGSRQERLLAQVSAVLGGIGLLLAAAGLYGMMAYTVSRRTSEMGIRMALGARPGDVVHMVLRESSVLVLGGFAAGIVGAFAAARLVAGFLFGVAPTDPGIVAAAASILMMVGLLAAWLPALRAARVAPINALRHD